MHYAGSTGGRMAFWNCNTYVKKRATPCAVFQDLERLKDIRDAPNWAALQRSLGEWLRTFPKPLDVMAANVPVVRRCS